MPIHSITSSDARHGGVGLVLGAGGATGAAFHAGTLLALHQDLGWDPNSANVIVGSSAGSIIGCLLRAGLSDDDLAAWGTSAAALSPGKAARRLLDEVGETPHRLTPSLPTARPVSPALLRSLLPPQRSRILPALLTLLPDGWINAGPNLERVGELLPDWPASRLWLTAVRMSDAQRVVFGRDDIAVTPGRAVAASCAIPAMFTPVTIDGQRYIDGGAHSTTNADLLLDAGVSTAVILSPMSAPAASLGWRPDRVFRSMCRRLLEAECDQLTQAGIEVHIFEPDASTLQSMGVNALDQSRAPAVVRDSFLAAGARLAQGSSLASVLS